MNLEYIVNRVVLGVLIFVKVCFALLIKTINTFSIRIVQPFLLIMKTRLNLQFNKRNSKKKIIKEKFCIAKKILTGVKISCPTSLFVHMNKSNMEIMWLSEIMRINDEHYLRNAEDKNKPLYTQPRMLLGIIFNVLTRSKLLYEEFVHYLLEKWEICQMELYMIFALI